MPRLELFPFCYRESFTGKLVKARYRAGRHEIAARYAEWETIGPPEIRDVDPGARYFMEGPAARGADAHIRAGATDQSASGKAAGN